MNNISIPVMLNVNDTHDTAINRAIEMCIFETNARSSYIMEFDSTLYKSFVTPTVSWDRKNCILEIANTKIHLLDIQSAFTFISNYIVKYIPEQNDELKTLIGDKFDLSDHSNLLLKYNIRMDISEDEYCDENNSADVKWNFKKRWYNTNLEELKDEFDNEVYKLYYKKSPSPSPQLPSPNSNWKKYDFNKEAPYAIDEYDSSDEHEPSDEYNQYMAELYYDNLE